MKGMGEESDDSSENDLDRIEIKTQSHRTSGNKRYTDGRTNVKEKLI